MGKPVDRLVVEIPEDILARLRDIPDSKTHGGFAFLPWHDELLRDYWRTKRQADIAELIGCNETTARKRYRELVRT